jgi:two-component system, OmpR family, response regulator ArlR
VEASLMAGEKILIIEDEAKIARFLELELKFEGYSVEISQNGREGLEKALEKGFDLILLDVMLPSMNGMEVLRRLRQSSDIPVIILTAKDEITDKVNGLDLGADDYITKPFAIEELLARIRVALKRVSKERVTGNILKFEKLELDQERHLVKYNTNIIELTKREYDLLKFFMENKDIVLTREKLLESVWGYDYMGDTNVVDVYVRYLRSKIDDEYGIKLIHTVRGVGYQLKYE